MKKTIRLQQDQVWKKGDEYLRIVRLERLEVEYKAMANLESFHGTRHTLTKKEFCRLLKNAVLLPPPARLAVPTPDLLTLPEVEKP